MLATVSGQDAKIVSLDRGVFGILMPLFMQGPLPHPGVLRLKGFSHLFLVGRRSNGLQRLVDRWKPELRAHA
jgi:hypothetical protein